MTVVTYGATVNRALQAARQAEERGVSLEILDLRSLSPFDWDAIAASVRKTSKALVLTEDSRSFGYGGEIASRIGEELYADLDAPVRRLGAKDTFVAYAPGARGFHPPADFGYLGGGSRPRGVLTSPAPRGVAHDPHRVAGDERAPRSWG